MEQYKEEIESILPAFITQLKHIQQATTEVKHMQQQIEVRNEENASHINKVFQEIVLSLNKRNKRCLMASTKPLPPK